MTSFVAGASPILLLEWWKPVVGFETLYEISNVGRVFSVRKCLVRVAFDDTRGYLNVALRTGGKQYNRRIHRMVAEAFIGPCPAGLVRNHKDGWKRNNRQSNLEYVTTLQNNLHAIKLGLCGDFKRNTAAARLSNCKIGEDEVRRIRSERGRGVVAKLAEEYKIIIFTIYKIRRRELWKEVV